MTYLRGGFSNAAWAVFCVFIIVYMLSPLILVVLFSFGQNPHATVPMGGVTLKWYRVLFQNQEFWAAVQNSVIITLSVGAISTTVGTLAALGLARWNNRLGSVITQAITIPVALPPLVIGLSLASVYSLAGLQFGVGTVIPGLLVFTQPFVVLIVSAQLRTFDYSIIESARDLGASPTRAFFTVVMPILRPTLIGAGLIAMAIALDDFIITSFTIGGGGLTLPVMIWGNLRTSLDPSVNALGTIITVTAMSAGVASFLIGKYRG